MWRRSGLLVLFVIVPVGRVCYAQPFPLTGRGTCGNAIDWRGRCGGDLELLVAFAAPAAALAEVVEQGAGSGDARHRGRPAQRCLTIRTFAPWLQSVVPETAAKS